MNTDAVLRELEGMRALARSLGIPPGPLSITIGAHGFHSRIEAGMTASAGAKLGPLTINLVKLKPGQQPTLELVGIGVKLIAGNGDALVVEMFPTAAPRMQASWRASRSSPSTGLP